MDDLNDPVPEPIDDIHEFMRVLQDGGAMSDGRSGGGMRSQAPLTPARDITPLHPRSQPPVLPFWSTLVFGLDRRAADQGKRTRAAAEARIAYALIALSCVFDFAVWSYGARVFMGALHTDSWVLLAGAVVMGGVFAVAFAAFEVSFYRTELRRVHATADEAAAATEPWAAGRRQAGAVGGLLFVAGVAYLGTSGAVSWTVLAFWALASGAVLLIGSLAARVSGRNLALVGGRVAVIFAAAFITSLPIDLMLYETDIDNNIWEDFRGSGAIKDLIDGTKTEEEGRAAELARYVVAPTEAEIAKLTRYECGVSRDCEKLDQEVGDAKQCRDAASRLVELEAAGEKTNPLTGLPASCASLATVTLTGRRGSNGERSKARRADLERYERDLGDAQKKLGEVDCKPKEGCIEQKQKKVAQKITSMATVRNDLSVRIERLEGCEKIPDLATLRGLVEQGKAPKECVPTVGGFADRLRRLHAVVQNDAGKEHVGVTSRSIAYFLALILPLTVVLNKLTASESVHAALHVPDASSARWIVGLSASELRSVLLDPSEPSTRRRTALLYLDLLGPLALHQLEWLRVAVDDEECRRTISRLMNVESYSARLEPTPSSTEGPLVPDGSGARPTDDAEAA